MNEKIWKKSIIENLKKLKNRFHKHRYRYGHVSKVHQLCYAGYTDIISPEVRKCETCNKPLEIFFSAGSYVYETHQEWWQSLESAMCEKLIVILPDSNLIWNNPLNERFPQMQTTSDGTLIRR
jgi:hypothetical protein